MTFSTANIRHFLKKSSVLLTVILCLISVTAYAKKIPPPVYAPYFDKLPCLDRIGRCFDAVIGNQRVQVIVDKKRFEALKAEIGHDNRSIYKVYWELPAPVTPATALQIQVFANDLGRPHVGEPKEEPEILITPLDGQELTSELSLNEARGVTVEGQAVVTAQNVLTQQHLPPGRYLFTLTYTGAANWERKVIYVVVAEEKTTIPN